MDAQTRILDGMLVDILTGEIIAFPGFDTYPYRAPRPDPVIPTFTDIRSIAGLGRFLAHIDRRTLVRANDCRRLFDLDKGEHHLKGRVIRLTPSQYLLMDRLVQRLDYANSIITTPGDLAYTLRVDRKNVYRYLSQLNGMVRARGPRDGMAKGSIRVDVNPAYGYRFTSDWFGLARQDAITEWHRHLMQ